MGVGTIRNESRRSLWRSRWAAIGAAVAVTLGGGGLFVANAASSPASSVVTIDPVRILDTRTDVGLPGPFVSAVSQKLQVTGSTVPAGATGVLLNVTVVNPSADGFLSVRPGDASGAPSTSSLNFKAGDIVPNSVQVGLPTSGANAGQIDITYDAFGQAGPATEVLIDAVGYMVAGGGGATGPAGPAGPQGPQGIPGPATGSAGGDLTGNYPNPAIAANAVNSAKIANATITQDDLAANSVGNAQLQTKVFFAKVQYDAAGTVILAGSPGVNSQAEAGLGFPKIVFPQSMDNCAITATTSAGFGTSIVRLSSGASGAVVQLAIQDGANAAVRTNFNIIAMC